MKLRGECQTGDLSLKFNSMTVISLHPWRSSHKEKAEKEEERAVLPADPEGGMGAECIPPDQPQERMGGINLIITAS